MKHFYRLLNYEFSRLFASATLLYFGVIATPLVFLNIAAKKSGNIYGRFEDLYADSGSIIVFAVFFAILCGIFIKNIYSDYWGSKGIYTLLSLPIKREYIYFSKLTAFFIVSTGFIGAQLVGYMIAYWFFAPDIIYDSAGMTIPREMHNGLFLSFIRSDFMRLFLPAGHESIVSSLAALTAVVCAVYYGALCERSRRYWGYIFIVFAAGLIIYTFNYRMQALYYSDYINTYPYSAVLFLLSGFFIWHGIRLVKSGAIA
ncbi:MAG: hypothetical protein PWQ93_1458 [Clostridiales bacterium]|nr:hypothetical protein [Clostridiales bacterium]